MTRLLITGVNRGIGAALAAEAVARGHCVVGTTRDGRDGTVPLMLDEPRTIAGQMSGIGPLDILINNAGVISPDRQSPLDMDFAGYAHTLTINSIAPLAVAQAVLPQLRKSAAPRILTISSQMAWMGYRKADRIAYRASKAAVNKVMQGLATAHESERNSVALVDPGWVRTEMGDTDAEEDPLDVASGILNIAWDLTVEDTGKFSASQVRKESSDHGATDCNRTIHSPRLRNL